MRLTRSQSESQIPITHFLKAQKENSRQTLKTDDIGKVSPQSQKPSLKNKIKIKSKRIRLVKQLNARVASTMTEAELADYKLKSKKRWFRLFDNDAIFGLTNRYTENKTHEFCSESEEGYITKVKNLFRKVGDRTCTRGMVEDDCQTEDDQIRYDEAKLRWELLKTIKECMDVEDKGESASDK